MHNDPNDQYAHGELESLWGWMSKVSFLSAFWPLILLLLFLVLLLVSLLQLWQSNRLPSGSMWQPTSIENLCGCGWKGSHFHALHPLLQPAHSITLATATHNFAMLITHSQITVSSQSRDMRGRFGSESKVWFMFILYIVDHKCFFLVPEWDELKHLSHPASRHECLLGRAAYCVHPSGVAGPAAPCSPPFGQMLHLFRPTQTQILWRKHRTQAKSA